MSTVTLAVDFVTETCCYKECGVTFAFNRDYFRQVNNDTTRWWYCPNGHRQHYTGKSDEQKLRESQARETALQDQLEATIRDAEAQRVELARIRQRIANGVCPCCQRSFSNVRSHMETQHPDYTAPVMEAFKCSCGRAFDTFHGLRVHQGWSRPEDWARPGKSRWSAHLTAGATS